MKTMANDLKKCVCEDRVARTTRVYYVDYNGDLQGDALLFDIDGNLLEKRCYKDDKLVGDIIRYKYDKNGNVIKTLNVDKSELKDLFVTM